MPEDIDSVLVVHSDRCKSECDNFYLYTDRYGNVWQIWYKRDDYDYTVPIPHRYSATTQWAMNLFLSQFVGPHERVILGSPPSDHGNET